jgi:mannose-6-phosphate isomerase-like protein (cupin superfamily)
MNQVPLLTDDHICAIIIALKGPRMALQSDSCNAARLATNEIAHHFHDTADRLLLDTHLANDDAASAGGFRASHDTLPHYHATRDWYLYVLSGRGTFWIGHFENGREFSRRARLFFRRGTIRVLPSGIDGSAVVHPAGTPRCNPHDILFVDHADRSSEAFIRPPRSAQQ